MWTDMKCEYSFQSIIMAYKKGLFIYSFFKLVLITAIDSCQQQKENKLGVI